MILVELLSGQSSSLWVFLVTRVKTTHFLIQPKRRNRFDLFWCQRLSYCPGEMLRWVWLCNTGCGSAQIFISFSDFMKRCSRERMQRTPFGASDRYIFTCSEKPQLFFICILGPDVWLGATAATITMWSVSVRVSVRKTLLIVSLTIQGSVQAWSSCPLVRHQI